MAYRDVLAKMAEEPQFAEHVRSEPAEALTGYDLTAEEVSSLSSMSADSEPMTESLDERQSKSSLLFTGELTPGHLAPGHLSSLLDAHKDQGTPDGGPPART
jgi:hypothetical protein